MGGTGLQIAPLAFGGNVFGWTVDEKMAFRLLDEFVDGGFNLIDTADSYSRWAPGNKGGESEIIIGNWTKKRRNRQMVVIATKVGSDMGQGRRDISKKYILQAAENSLRRLQTDFIDLYQTHWDVESVPVEETLEAYRKLVDEGKVRWIGASNLSPERLRASLAASDRNGYPRYQTLQPEYNLCDRQKFENSYEKICAEQNLGVISYYSLASGFLSGKYRTEADFEKSPRGNGVRKYFDGRGLRIIGALDEVSKQFHATPATIAFAWLQSRPTVTAPIASATNLDQLESLMKASELKLTQDAISILNAASEY